MTQEKIISIEEILNSLKSRKGKILIPVAIVVIIVAVYSLIMPFTFTSTTTIMPPDDKSGGSSLSSYLQSMSGGISLGGSLGSDKSKLFRDIIKSRTISEGVYDEINFENYNLVEGLDEDELIDIISNSIEVEVLKSGIISISSYFSTDYFPGGKAKEEAAKLSAEISMKAVSQLDRLLINKNTSSARKSKEYIENELNKYKVKLDSVALELQKFQSENKVLAIEDQTQAIVEQAIELSTKLNEFKIELNLARIQYSASSPKVKTIKDQIDFLEKQYLEIQTGGINDSDFALSLNDVPRLTRLYAELFRDREVLEKVILYLETQRHQEAIQEEKELPIIEVLDEAKVPKKRYSPSRAKMVLISLFLALIISIIVNIIIVNLNIRDTN